MNGKKRGIIMGREIKFRVLIDNKIYYQDKYEAYDDNLSSIDICKETITITSFYNYENVYRFKDEKVKLMQYTGLKDKNGKEIYEGDILFFRDENMKYVVVWQDAAFIIKSIEIRKYSEKMYWIDDVEICCEIVGNIYENKNLLEENK